MAVITISREYGSCGGEIARQVAMALGYNCVDKTLPADVARAAGTTEEYIIPYDEKDEHRFRRFLRKFFIPNSLSANSWAYYAPDLFIQWPHDAVEFEPILDADEVTSTFRGVLEQLWNRGNVVIVGRGSQSILAGKPNTFHVRIVASIDDRVAQVMASQGLTYREALEQIQAIDKQRARYLKHHYHANWTDAELYDLVLNTSFMGIQQAVGTIIAAVRHQEGELEQQGGDERTLNDGDATIVSSGSEINNYII